MKFGKYLATRHLDLPGYASHFMDYKGLKKLIKRLAVAAPASPADFAPGSDAAKDAYKRLQEHKAIFFFQLERELEKVQSFYQQKQSELVSRLDILTQKMEAGAKSGTLTKNSVTYISIYEGFQRFRRDLEQLEQFIELNGTGFSKVLKKWDKRSRSHTKELYLSRAVEVQPMFHRDVLVALSDKVNTSILELEALDAGDSVVFNPAATRVSNQNSSDDLYHEFVKFAVLFKEGDPEQQATLDEWITQLKNADNPTTRMSQVFLMALGTDAADDALMALLKTGLVDLNETDEIAGRNCLHLAASTSGRVRIIQKALEQKVDVNLKDVYGRTPLHYAALHNRIELIKPFKDSGADVNALDNDNFRPLHNAIVHRYALFTEKLVESGANTHGDSEKDYVPLNFACQCGAIDEAAVLLKCDKNPDMVADAEGLYPLHIVARAGFANMVPLLVEYGAELDKYDKLNGWTALMYAASEGRDEAVRALLEAGANISLHDETGKSALFYAVWEGHPSALRLLAERQAPEQADKSQNVNPEMSARAYQITTSLDEINITSDSPEVISSTHSEEGYGGDVDAIPDLSLPPPIIPVQRYGHNFLDSKKVVVQLFFANGSDQSFVHFNSERKSLTAGRITLSTAGTRDSIPRNLTLPIVDREHVQVFQAEDITKFSIEFEIVPTFGTRLLAKASALPSIFGESRKTVHIAMFDALLRTVGQIKFTYLVIKPFSGTPLEITNFETYWKSTSVFENSSHMAHDESQTQLMYVTASSLYGDYSQMPVVLTRDLVPVVLPMSFECNNVQLPVAGFSYDELCRLYPSKFLTLAEALDSCTGEQINLNIQYPTKAETKLRNTLPTVWPDINLYVDKVLTVVFDHVRRVRKEKGEKARYLLFTSVNPDICALLNWKQPHYPVLFSVSALRTDGLHTTANGEVLTETPSNEQRMCVSLKEASQFAATNNLIGIVVPSVVLRLVPAVIPSIRLLGLVLVAEGTDSHLDGVDGIKHGHTLTFFKDISI